MRTALLLAALALLAAAPAAAQEGWAVELSGGSAFQLATPLTIRQAGEPEIDVTARWETRPLRDAPYYALRLGRWSHGRAWELELLHHKLYLDDPPAEVQRFEISHGFNLVALLRAVPRGAVLWRLGGGLVIAHPETTIRGRAAPEDATNLGGGYHLAGGVLQTSIGARRPLGRHFHVAAEAKLTLAYAEVPVAGGEATVPNVAIHGLLGFGCSR
jgi:hypothetical protein